MSAQRLPHCDFDPQDLHTRVRIEVPGRLDAISPAGEQIMAEARAWREALANASRHGGAHDATKSVEVCVACDEAKGMLIVVRDPGPGFDPGAIPSPTLGQNIFRHHGRGIYLINQLMDEVSFEKGGTEIRMRKR